MSVIDLHCHLLPAVDDGPATMSEALAMARLHVAAGVTTVAATPHVSIETPTEPAAIARNLSGLRAAISEQQIPLEVVIGAEVDVYRAAELPDEALQGITLGGGGWLLLEAPLRRGVPLDPCVNSLHARGHRILLAHPERSPLLQRNPSDLRRLVESGVLTQVTASSFAGRFGRVVQRYAEALLDEGLVHVVASDAHDVRQRPPGIPCAFAGPGGEEIARRLTQEIPAAILAGGPIPKAPVRRKPTRRLRALLTKRVI